jgi:hypothetical protein
MVSKLQRIMQLMREAHNQGWGDGQMIADLKTEQMAIVQTTTVSSQ